MAEKPTKTFDFVELNLAERPGKGTGRKATAPTVTVSDKGAIRLNSLASVPFAGAEYCRLFIEASKLMIQIKKAEKGEQNAVKLTNLKGTSQVSAGWWLQKLGYDYKAIGDQKYEGESLIVKDNFIVIKLDKEKKPQPKQTRQRRAPVPAAAPAAAPAQQGGDDIEL